jgi:hypothetical protein
VATDPDTADWAALSALDEASREQAMRSRFRELLALSPDERIAAEQDMLIAEESLETQEHGAMTLSRLRAWMSFDAAEIEADPRVSGDAQRHGAAVRDPATFGGRDQSADRGGALHAQGAPRGGTRLAGRAGAT